MTAERSKVLVIGGYGLFGGKIVRALADEPIDLIVAGRSADRAAAFCRSLGDPTASLQPLAIDTNDHRFHEALSAAAPSIVIHTSGPFQGQNYAVADACIARGAHYLDLADGREFVAGFGTLQRDQRARRQQVVALSGVSSVPALSSAVVAEQTLEFEAIESIDSAIYPGNRTERGRATIAAILSYVGAPLAVWQQGAWQLRSGWGDHRVLRLDQPIGRRYLANCDVPDLTLFPTYFNARTVQFQAGVELAVMHYGLRLMASIRRLGLVTNWCRYINAIEWLAARFESFGSDIGGMRVVVTGRTQGASVQTTWSLIATNGYGPEIPTIPARLLSRQLLRGEPFQFGARPALCAFDTQAFLAECDTRFVRIAQESTVQSTSPS